MPICVDVENAVLLGSIRLMIGRAVTIWTVLFIIWTIQINAEYAFGIRRGWKPPQHRGWKPLGQEIGVGNPSDKTIGVGNPSYNWIV